MVEIAKTRVFQEWLAQGLAGASKPVSAADVCVTLGLENKQLLNERILGALQDGPVTVFIEEVDAHTGSLTDGTQGLDSAILKKRREGKTERLVMLRMKGAVAEMALPLLSLAVAASTLSMPGMIVPSVAAIRAVWQNVLVLRSDKDSDAIAVYEAISLHSVLTKNPRNVASRSDKLISTSEIHELVPDVESSRVVAALKRLHDLKLIAVRQWGSQGGDLAAMENRWSTVF